MKINSRLTSPGNIIKIAVSGQTPAKSGFLKQILKGFENGSEFNGTNRCYI